MASTSLWAAPAASPVAVASLAYPATRATDLAEEQFGQKVADPYR